jgi:hypothetical protein
MTPVDTAAELLATRFPAAVAGFLGGSAASARRTSTSDLDVVVILDDGPAPFRETTMFEGWLVELFVHTQPSLQHYWDLDAANRRPPLLRMCAEGAQLVSVRGVGQRVKSEACRRLDAGPAPLSDAEWATRRYALSDLLDDLRGASRGPELPFVANAVLTACCEMALLAGGRWLGTGKWLARELEQLDTCLLHDLTAAHAAALVGESEAILALAATVLNRVGGPLSAGYRVSGQLPKG